jgi:hypothetical protein
MLIPKFWKNKEPKEGIDYEFYDFPDSDLTGIHLLKGKYSGIIYFYTTVKFSEEDNIPKLSYNYELYQTNNISENELTIDKNFDILVGDILTTILVNNET